LLPERRIVDPGGYEAWKDRYSVEPANKRGAAQLTTGRTNALRAGVGRPERDVSANRRAFTRIALECERASQPLRSLAHRAQPQVSGELVPRLKANPII
jgi:hypothetical protein